MPHTTIAVAARCIPYEISIIEQQAHPFVVWSSTAAGCALLLLAGTIAHALSTQRERRSLWRTMLVLAAISVTAGSLSVASWDMAHRYGYHICTFVHVLPVIPCPVAVTIARTSGWITVAAMVVVLLLIGIALLRTSSQTRTAAS